jgi:hypothetical protein
VSDCPECGGPTVELSIEEAAERYPAVAGALREWNAAYRVSVCEGVCGRVAPVITLPVVRGDDAMRAMQGH